MDNRSPYPPVPNARAIMEQKGSTEERVFLQYQFHQQTQTTLNEKWIFVFSKKKIFMDAKTPRKQLKGIRSLSWTSPCSLMYGCFPPMYPSVSSEWERRLAASCSCCCWGQARQEQRVLEMAALKDSGGAGGFPLRKPCALLRKRQPCPGGQQCLDLAFLVCLKPPCLRLPSPCWQ